MVMTYTGLCDFYFSFNLVCVFCLFATRAAQTRDPIFKHNDSKDAVWRKEVPYKCFPHQIFTASWEIKAKMKISINLETGKTCQYNMKR